MKTSRLNGEIPKKGSGDPPAHPSRSSDQEGRLDDFAALAVVDHAPITIGRVDEDGIHGWGRAPSHLKEHGCG